MIYKSGTAPSQVDLSPVLPICPSRITQRCFSIGMRLSKYISFNSYSTLYFRLAGTTSRISPCRYPLICFDLATQALELRGFTGYRTGLPHWEQEQQGHGRDMEHEAAFTGFGKARYWDTIIGLCFWSHLRNVCAGPDCCNTDNTRLSLR